MLRRAADFRGTQEAWFERLAADADAMREQAGKVDAMIEALSKQDAKLDRVLERKARGDAKGERRAARDAAFDDNLIPRDDFEMEAEPFAAGGSAEVFRAEYDYETVAVKRFRAAGGAFSKLKDDFSHELKIMCDQHHGSILQVRAAPSPCCL